MHECKILNTNVIFRSIKFNLKLKLQINLWALALSNQIA